MIDPPLLLIIITLSQTLIKFSLKSMVINFQSIVAKRAEFHSVINDHHPDIIFGNETWLTPIINTAKFFSQRI